jgi:hypothetical protein
MIDAAALRKLCLSITGIGPTNVIVPRADDRRGHRPRRAAPAGMAERDIAAFGSDDVSVSPAYERRVRLEAALGPVAGGLIPAAISLMLTKPGL